MINGCKDKGIRVQSAASNVVIEGNFLGTNPAGTASTSNTDPNDGIGGITAPANLRIGGLAPAARNLISGGDTKIGMGGGSVGPSGIVIQGNLIGTDITGTQALANGQAGIDLGNATNATIGGTSVAARNLISGNQGDGVSLFGSDVVSNSVIAGNFIGVDVTGTHPLGNNRGVDIETKNVTLGGNSAGAGNVISSNTNIGVVLGQSAAPLFSTVFGNFIGTDLTETLDLGNADRGIHAGAPDNVIGGPGPGEGNVIAHTHITGSFQTGVGVYVPASPRTTIRGNRIFDNEGVGIDIMAGGSPDGVTPNDPGDVDTGGNNLQNFPILSSVTNGATTHIQGILHSTASTAFDLDFYTNPACANFPREFQEGATYLGTAPVTTDGSGDATFDVTLPVATEAGARIAVTATAPDGSTSEFSQRLPFSVSPTSGPPAGGTNITLSGTDFAAGASVAVGGQAAGQRHRRFADQDHRTTAAVAPGVANDIVVTNTDATTGTLLKAFVSDFLDVPPVQQFHTYVDDARLQRHHRRYRRRQLRGRPADAAPADGGLPSQVAPRPLLHAPALRRNVPGCPVPFDFRRLDRSPRRRGHHGRMRRRQLLPDQPRASGPDGGLSPEGRARVVVLPPACAAIFADVPCPSPFADWIEQLAAEGSPAAAGTVTTARSTTTRAARWLCS